MCISANPVSLSSVIVVRVHVLSRRNVENDRSAEATDTGNVHRILSKLFTWG